MTMKTIRIGSGAGYSGDRIEPAVELALHGDIDYLVFECLAERTIAIAQRAKLADPLAGYDQLLEARMRAVLGACRERGIRIISNMGAANPQAGARKVQEIARELGIDGLRVAAVSGDDVLAPLIAGGHKISETGTPVANMGDVVISANAYIGAEPIVQALRDGADVVITGRVADPSLFLAPQIHEFGWAYDDWDKLGKGTLTGHLLECAGQVTGGYFADPDVKDVPDLARLGFPIGIISADGNAVITKVAGSGGRVCAATVKEQILYEVHNPAAYLTPDVTADFANVSIREIAPDQVAVTGATGHARPDTLKVSVGYTDGYIGEGQISYAGPGAVARGKLAAQIVRERFDLIGLDADELRFDLIGVNAIFGAALVLGEGADEVRLRVCGRTKTMAEARRIGAEVETLYTNGPASGGGAVQTTRQVVAMLSALIPRAEVHPRIEFFTSEDQ